MINAKILFCCGMLSKKTKGTKAAADKTNKPDAVINPELEAETKLANGSLYSGITDMAYNFSDNLSGWLFGGNKNKRKSEDKGNDKKEH